MWAFFIIGDIYMENEDILYERANMYSKLLDIEYKFILGRKNKLKEINVVFTEFEFIHLIGLHYLKDITDLRYFKMNELYKRLLSKEITYDTIKDSDYFDLITDRFEKFIIFETLLDESKEIYLYDYKKLKYTKIKAEYLIQCFTDDGEYYIFLDKYNSGKNKGKYFCKTFFKRNKFDYTKMQTKYTVLRKEKINIRTSEILLEQGKSKKELKI